MTAKTPGQAAYEAFRREFPDEDWGPWERIDSDGPPGWEAIAKAAIGDYARILADVTEQRDDLREQLAAADRATAEFRRQCSELAGELGAVTAERNRLRDRLAELRAALDECPAAAERDALRERLTALAAEMEAEAQFIAPASSRPDELPDIADQVRAEALMDCAGKIRAGIGDGQ